MHLCQSLPCMLMTFTFGHVLHASILFPATSSLTLTASPLIAARTTRPNAPAAFLAIVATGGEACLAHLQAMISLIALVLTARPRIADVVNRSPVARLRDAKRGPNGSRRSA